MSKRSYYRRSRRTYPKQKWQMTFINPAPIELHVDTFAANTFYAIHKTICQTVVPSDAAAHSVVSANNIVKAGNFKVKGTYSQDGYNTYASKVSVIVYVIFVPQGITPDNSNVSVDNLATSIFYSHPEWVLGWTRVDLDNYGNDNFSITSRLKRNLNSGDSIQLGVMFINNGEGNISGGMARIMTTVQYCARAN